LLTPVPDESEHSEKKKAGTQADIQPPKAGVMSQGTGTRKAVDK
jgi:hypothetical protein